MRIVMVLTRGVAVLSVVWKLLVGEQHDFISPAGSFTFASIVSPNVWNSFGVFYEVSDDNDAKYD